MKLKLLTAGICVALAPLSANVSALDFNDGKFTAKILFSQNFQTPLEIDPDSGAVLINEQDRDAESGFNRIRFALQLNAQFTDRISGFIELAEEPNDFGGGFDIKNDLSWIEIDVTKNTSVRIGNVVPTTMNFIRYTDGADVQNNPLVGNGSNDIITAETGAWITGSHDTNLGAWDYNLTVTRPSFFEDFNEDAGYNYTLRSSLKTPSGFGFGAGFFKSTGDASCVDGICTTVGGVRGGGPLQGDGDPYSFASTQTGARNKHVGLAPGIDAYAWQADVLYENDRFTVHGFFGQVNDNFSFAAGDLQTDGGTGTFSTTDAEYNFWGLFGQVNITRDELFLAGRWTASTNEASGIDSDEDLYRVQGGIGWWPSDRVLVKAEYVYQKEEANSGGGACAFGTGDCDWEGLVFDISTAF